MLSGGQIRTIFTQKLCTNFVQSQEIILTFVKNICVMTKKKDLYNLHCRVEHLTAEKLKAWSDKLGYSMGEVIDCVVDGYEGFCNDQDEWLRNSDVCGQLSKLNKKIDKIAEKVGVK